MSVAHGFTMDQSCDQWAEKYELGISNNRDSEGDGVTFPRGGSKSPLHI